MADDYKPISSMSEAELKKATLAAQGTKDINEKYGMQNKEQAVQMDATRNVQPFEHGLTPVTTPTPAPAPSPTPPPTPESPDRG